MNIGDEWIYRLRDRAPSERVRILAIEQHKQRVRVDIEFLDGEKSGTRENIPGNRLRGPWCGVEQFDWTMSNWERLQDEYDLTQAEEYAIDQVFDLLVPEEVATCDLRPAKYAVEIYSREKFEELLGTPLAEITSTAASFDLDAATIFSAVGALMAAELICHHNPMPVLDWVMEEEKQQRESCKRGRSYQAHDGSGERTSDPEWEYQWYLRHDRPVHELLRQWCGHRAVTLQERLVAAEAEVRRLDVLVARLIDIVKEHNGMLADVLERQHEEERIRPETARPIVDRPLNLSEIPVRYIKVPRRRWW
ncbi:hypothetical protein [Nocardia pseudovaccinii]|uniref:hypothetical protein n=1 Tax=Nocardia pseudovaccinii TaxID=189540 RepID=UPI0007A39FDB|nr:hypothetical protein [Nocardia pseudovaccinii]